MSRTRRINRATAKRAETPTQDSEPAVHPETPDESAETPVANPEEEQVLIPVRAPSSGSGVTPSTPDSDVNVAHKLKEAVDDSHSKADDPGG